MTKGLKQMVEEAHTAIDQENERAAIKPVDVSAPAVKTLASYMRAWSGWSNALLDLTPDPSEGVGVGRCDHTTKTFSFNTDRLILNPNRVLNMVTPFRLKQEAVLTGAMLHEAAHARYSRWRPRSVEAMAEWVHNDTGQHVSEQSAALAVVLEEARIEGKMAKDATRFGAAGLAWTMRVTAAQILPHNPTLNHEPGQRLMDFMSTWILQAGRQIALQRRVGHKPGYWVSDFTAALHTAMVRHLNSEGCDPLLTGIHASRAINLLAEAVTCDDDTGTTLVDLARKTLEILFPETGEDDGDEAPMPSVGCQSEQGEGESGDTESTEQGEGEGEGEQDDAESTESEDDGATDGTDESTEDTEVREEMEETLRQMAKQSSEASEQDAEAGKAAAADGWPDPDAEGEEKEDGTPGGSSGGLGGAGLSKSGWRAPTAEERGIQDSAERFIRRLVAPTESSKVSITDSPSSTVDGAALAAWRAAGGDRDPRFFRRTQRSVDTCPPVKIAVLVDVSGSMEDLQKPSAVLSWALANAALDLKNFAGRGQQIETCLIHWGSTARVIQRNGETLPGIKEDPCAEGTSAMGAALDLVEQEMPGFLSLPADGKPENKLLVQFTDWELHAFSLQHAKSRVSQALAAGVNMLTVAPEAYSNRNTRLPYVLSGRSEKRGASTLIKYNPMIPGQVWESAAEALD